MTTIIPSCDHLARDHWSRSIIARNIVCPIKISFARELRMSPVLAIDQYPFRSIRFALTNCGSLEITNEICISVVAEVVSYHVHVNLSGLVHHVDVENLRYFRVHASSALTYDNFIYRAVMPIVLRNISVSDHYCENYYWWSHETLYPWIQNRSMKIHFTRSYMGFLFVIFYLVRLFRRHSRYRRNFTRQLLRNFHQFSLSVFSSLLYSVFE